MIIPGVLAQQALLVPGGAGTLWTPLNMTAVPQIYLDAQDSVLTDVGGFCSAIRNLGAMGADGDFTQSTISNRPAMRAAELNGNRVLSFDGENDVLLGATTSQKEIFRNVSAAWVFTVVKKRGTDGSDMNRPVFACTIGASAAARFTLRVGLIGAGEANKPHLACRRLDADAQASLASATNISGSYKLLMATLDYSTRVGRIYLDGVLDVENTTLTAATGATSNTASTEALAIGNLYNAAAGADIDLAAIIISSALPSIDDHQRLHGWAAHKYGLTANLPSGHPYKSSPPMV